MQIVLTMFSFDLFYDESFDFVLYDNFDNSSKKTINKENMYGPQRKQDYEAPDGTDTFIRNGTESAASERFG